MGTSKKAGGGGGDGACLKPDPALGAVTNHVARATPALAGFTLAETADVRRVTFLPTAGVITGWTHEAGDGNSHTGG